jgi:hypothetical protein
MVLCLDQPFTEAEEKGYVEGSKPCRGCELSDVGRPTRVIVNFIRYDEPKLVRDAKGEPSRRTASTSLDGVEPALVVCNFATGVGSRLAFLESQYGVGITNHVCTIHKTGDKNNPFMIDVVEPNKPPEEFERKLFEKKLSRPRPSSRSCRVQVAAAHELRRHGARLLRRLGPLGLPGRRRLGRAAPAENIYAQAAARPGGPAT